MLPIASNTFLLLTLFGSVPAELNDRRKSWREAEFAPSGGLSHNLLHHSNLEPAVQFLKDTTRFSGSAPNVQINSAADTTPNHREANEKTGFEADAEGASFKAGKIDAQAAGWRFAGSGPVLGRWWRIASISSRSKREPRRARSARRIRLRTLSGWVSPKAIDSSRSVTGVNSREGQGGTSFRIVAHRKAMCPPEATQAISTISRSSCLWSVPGA